MFSTRSATEDDSIYRRVCDFAIVVGVFVIALHLIVGLPIATLGAAALALCWLTGIALYFKTRDKDVP